MPKEKDDMTRNNATKTENDMKRKHIIEIYPNGDPYGKGFQGRESTDGGKSWFYLGNIGAAPRSFWRLYCRKNNIVLRYE